MNEHNEEYKIENYDPNKRLTKCYFLKVINVNPFTPLIGFVNGGNAVLGDALDNGVQTEETLPKLNYVAPRNENISNVKSGLIGGKNNRVDYSSKNINITGDNNLVNSYLKNLEVVLPEDKKVVLQEINQKLSDIQNRFN